MRFRPANISLINRRHYLPRLLLTLFPKDNDKNTPESVPIDRVTPYRRPLSFTILAGKPAIGLGSFFRKVGYSLN